MQQELEMEELGLEPHPEEDEDLAVEDNHGKIILLTLFIWKSEVKKWRPTVLPFLEMTVHISDGS